MAVFAKGADPEALELSATNFAGYARTCDEVRESIGATASVIRANWAGGDLQALAGKVPAVQQQLTTISHTLASLGQKLTANARAQQVASGASGGLPTGGPYGAPYGPGGGGEPGGGPGGEGGGEPGGEGGEEKPGWLETTETAIKPLEITATGLGATAFGLFNHTAGGGLHDLFMNGKLLDLYTEDALKAANTMKGLTSFETAGAGINSAVKLLDGRAIGSFMAEGSKAGELVGKVGVLGPISVAAGAFSTYEDLAHGHYGDAALDGASTALTAGALLAPPPADIVCGVGALGIAAYQNIPFVHDAVDGAVHGVEKAGEAVGHAASSAWHAITSIF